MSLVSKMSLEVVEGQWVPDDPTMSTAHGTLTLTITAENYLIEKVQQAIVATVNEDNSEVVVPCPDRVLDGRHRKRGY